MKRPFQVREIWPTIGVCRPVSYGSSEKRAALLESLRGSYYWGEFKVEIRDSPDQPWRPYREEG